MQLPQNDEGAERRHVRTPCCLTDGRTVQAEDFRGSGDYPSVQIYNTIRELQMSILRLPHLPVGGQAQRHAQRVVLPDQ
jgi:hypothetical protein